MRSNILLGFLSFLSHSTATKFHVHQGCILLDDAHKQFSVCQGRNPPEISTGDVRVKAGFNATNRLDTIAVYHLEKHFAWNPNYADVWFGEDGCLYQDHDRGPANAEDKDGIEQCSDEIPEGKESYNPYHLRIRKYGAPTDVKEKRTVGFEA